MNTRKFDYPLNLHISQTEKVARLEERKFDYPLNLHISQTKNRQHIRCLSFDYPLNLHISQTSNLINGLSFRVDKFKRC